VILLLHHRYRVPGGEERAVEDLARLIREELGEEAAILQRDSARLPARAAAAGLLAGGLAPEAVASAVRRTGARVVHAHNVQPTWGWRALAAARRAGARVVLHLHNYRLVCAPGTCFTRGEDCVRCHGRWTWPGVRLNCRGSRVESTVYAAGLALGQRRLVAAADAFLVPSAFALARLRTLGAPLGDRARVIPSVQHAFAAGSAAARGEFALVAGRLTAEKGIEDAMAGCRAAGVPLVIAGDGPDRARLEALAGREASASPGVTFAGREASPSPGVTFAGRVAPEALAGLRARAALAIVPSRYAEILPLAALEAMAAGLPVVAARAGGLAELVPEEGLYAPGDAGALAARVRALYADAAAGERALAVARARTAPPVVARALRAVYDG